jgi:hypothetical protein
MRKLLFLLVAGVLLVPGCGNPTQPCGVFTFSGSPTTAPGEYITDQFAFNPSLCGASCTSNQIVYIQIVRVIDMTTGEFLAPGPQQQARIVTGNPTVAYNGWSVDRLEDHNWGYYGRNNDGTFDSALTPGSSSSPATLIDTPGGWPPETWFDAVDVPVCIDSDSSCVNNLLGYYYWLYTEDSSGVTGTPYSEIGVDWMQTAVDLSIAKWNANAPGLGKTVYPAFTRLH